MSALAANYETVYEMDRKIDYGLKIKFANEVKR